MNSTTRVLARASSSVVRVRAVMLVAAIVALLAAACSDNPSSGGAANSSNAGASTNSQSATSQLLAYSRCMRSNGVSNFPDPNSSEGFDKAILGRLAQSNPQYQGANRSCQHLLPTPTVPQQHQVAEMALQFSHCMRTHGVSNFPDPGADGRIPDPATFGIDQGSPRFEAANQACRNYRPPYIPSNAAYNAYARTQGS